MKIKSSPAPASTISDDDIRSYAEHLWEQSGRAPDHDVDNWLEAKACLEANIPPHQSHCRLHHHLSRKHTKVA